MEKRFVLFLVLSMAILFGYQQLMSVLYPRPARPPAVAQREGEPNDKADAKKPAAKPVGKEEKAPDGQTPEPKIQPAEKPAQPEANEQEPPAEKPKPEPVPDGPQKWITLGSGDPASPYRMLVTLTNRGAAVASVELNSPRFLDLDDAAGKKYERIGYLGRIVFDTTVRGAGCPVNVVGTGTPAAAAGLKAGDLIKQFGQLPINGADDLDNALAKTRPGQTVPLVVSRQGKQITLQATLGERPLAVIAPEADDPLSMLMTLGQIDEEKLPDWKKGEGQATDVAAEREGLGRELAGTQMRRGVWEIAEADESHVTFVRKLPAWNLEVRKIYRLAKVPEEAADDPNYRAYHLVFDVQIRNLDNVAHQVAYVLDGPNGLPIEGWWYSTKVSRTWGSVGVRDVAVAFNGEFRNLVGCRAIADGSVASLPWKEESLTFIGVDAQYFSSVLIPQKEMQQEIWFAESRPITVGKVDPELKQLTNTSFRLISKPHELPPDGILTQRFELFAGPKKPEILSQYGLGEIVYYGWFSWVARPLLGILHFLYSVVRNYGIAIILLTVMVRLCMFPLSRKQTLNALKMQELQPEIKKLQEKYKKDLEARTRAQQELFRKHNYNPLGGCLVMFIQLPIFVALYRSLMVDVELRQAPLISDAIRWCSNLAAPDMFFDWSGFMPAFVDRGVGLFGLGPYFNILPVATIVLFIAQQKMLMPPPADEQAAMQQNIMKYMMIFMGLLFFKVASGLCIYFIASSLWGLGERQFLPKRQTETADAGDALPSTKRSGSRGSTGGNGAPDRKKKRSRGKK